MSLPSNCATHNHSQLQPSERHLIKFCMHNRKKTQLPTSECWWLVGGAREQKNREKESKPVTRFGGGGTL